MITPKIISFYLPQFHPIPENDKWWQKGFTEWDNVRTASPSFSGHYQPHIPVPPLGHYDLRNPRTQMYQATMARRAGLHGFCYYYYWFGGKKLLEAPLEAVLHSGQPNLPFCICWANHDWTRAWYGQNKEVLIGQDYSKDSMRRFIQDIKPILTDDRYITVNGKPILLVYQAEEIPDPIGTTNLWRSEAAAQGIPSLYLIRVEALSWDTNPEELGFDAAVEFAPDWRMSGQLLNKGNQPRRVDYKTTIRNMLAKPEVHYKRFRGAFPQWDNSPRYKKAALVFDNPSPGAFAFHLKTLVEYTRARFDKDEQFIFINAWNEWGEGCHIEPCKKYGNQWLEAIRYALGK